MFTLLGVGAGAAAVKFLNRRGGDQLRKKEAELKELVKELEQRVAEAQFGGAAAKIAELQEQATQLQVQGLQPEVAGMRVFLNVLVNADWSLITLTHAGQH